MIPFGQEFASLNILFRSFCSLFKTITPIYDLVLKRNSDFSMILQKL